ncbi:MAG: hypothetical protein ACI89M_001627 [Chitinophagales bacterium]|jgi:hypothetical protein
MKDLKNKLIALTLILAPFIGFSQLCSKTVNYCMYPKKDGFLFNGQSQSGAFLQGDTAEVTIVVYNNMEYRISACCPLNEELSGKLQFQVIEMTKEAQWKTSTVTQTVNIVDGGGKITGTKEVTKEVKKRVYVKTPIVRYDGFAEKEASEFVMISSKTRKLTIKVYVPEVGGEGGDLEVSDLSCIGLLIEHRPAQKNIGQFGR